MKRKTVLSGRKLANPITSTTGLSSKNTKNPTLFDHTTKIEQKLAKLKEQVQEKKKNHIQVLNKTNNKIVSVKKQKIITNEALNVDKQLNEFLENINLSNYGKLLAENGIDSLQILKEIKQKQLQEIGVAKGHALKIMVSLRKMLQSREKASRKQLSSAETAENSLKITSKAFKGTQEKIIKPNKPQQNKNQSAKNQPLQIVIQTMDQGWQTDEQPLPKRRYFCLYCYQVCPKQFCGEDCQKLYNKMFQKYQKNLAKVQQLFGSKITSVVPNKQQGQQIDENEFVSDIGFLDYQGKQLTEKYQQSQNFDENAYSEALNFISKINQQQRNQGFNRILQGKQEEQI